MKTATARLTRARYLAALAASLCWIVSGSSHGQTASPESIAEMLRDGGYVLVMRHASSPREVPNQRARNPRNTEGERQLDETGRAHATAVGYSFRALGIEIGEVLSSPAFRAAETLLYLGYEDAEAVEQLAPGNENAAWLREKAAERPAEGMNLLIVTHAPNIAAAFGDAASGMSDGETLVVRPGGDAAQVVGRMTVEDWAKQAVDRSGS